MDDELVFYTNPMSRGQLTRWMLEEVGAPYRTEIVAYGPEMKSEAYLAINPMGKVPAIRHRGQVVTEGAAICAYLADAFPGAGLAPAADSPARAPYYRWLFFGAGPVEQAVFNTWAGFSPGPDKSRAMGYGDFDITLDTLEGALTGGDYLAGDAFSAADLYVGGFLGFVLGFGIVPKRPAFEAYVARLDARPARQRAKAIDAALIAQTPT